MLLHIQNQHPAHWDPRRARTQGLNAEFLDMVTISLWELDAIAPKRISAYPFCKAIGPELTDNDPMDSVNSEVSPSAPYVKRITLS